MLDDLRAAAELLAVMTAGMANRRMLRTCFIASHLSKPATFCVMCAIHVGYAGCSTIWRTKLRQQFLFESTNHQVLLLVH